MKAAPPGPYQIVTRIDGWIVDPEKKVLGNV
jgi:hypothetical protein